MFWGVLLIPALACITACFYDIKPSHEIPDWISITTLTLGVLLTLTGIIPSWQFVLGTIVYATFAVLLSYFKVWGGGDSKILISLGGYYGIIGLPALTFFATLTLTMITYRVLSGRNHSIGLPFFVIASIAAVLTQT